MANEHGKECLLWVHLPHFVVSSDAQDNIFSEGTLFCMVLYAVCFACKSLQCQPCKVSFGLQGTTKVALYGLGNVRDERLGRMFQTPGCVDWCVFNM